MNDTQRIEDVPADYVPPKLERPEAHNMAPWPVVPKVYRAINNVTKAIGKEGISKDRKNMRSRATASVASMTSTTRCRRSLGIRSECILPRMLEPHPDRAREQAGRCPVQRRRGGRVRLRGDGGRRKHTGAHLR